MNKQSKIFHQLMRDYLITPERINDFCHDYSENLGYSHLKYNGMTIYYHSEYIAPYHQLVEQDLSLHGDNKSEIGKMMYNSDIANDDRHILHALHGSSKADDIYYYKEWLEHGQMYFDYIPLKMYDIPHVKRGLYCYLSDPFHPDRNYGRIWMFLLFSNKMPHVNLKHPVAYYKRHIKTPRDAKEYFKITPDKYSEPDSDGNGMSFFSLPGDAGTMEDTFCSSAFGKALNEANH